jgi:AcrR family transcriptional regulator
MDSLFCSTVEHRLSVVKGILIGQGKVAQTLGKPEKLSKQESKSVKMRETVCKATVACLFELGYNETTISRIVERAGVSRGAVQHHFPTKEDLIIAAAERLLERSLDFSNPREWVNDTSPSMADELLKTWSKVINTKQYQALLEILTAARTDKRLRERISPILQRWNSIIDRRMVEAFESVGGDDKDVELLMLMNRSLMRGLVIQDRYMTDPAYALTVVNRWIELVAPLLRPRQNKKIDAKA